MPRLPKPRGPVSEELLSALAGPVSALSVPDARMDEEDLQLALYACYELQYRGFDGVDERWETAPSLVTLRDALEEQFEIALEDAVGPVGDPPPPDEMDLALRAIVDADDAPPLSTF